jgi:hypothetical protein
MLNIFEVRQKLHMVPFSNFVAVNSGTRNKNPIHKSKYKKYDTFEKRLQTHTS